MTFYSPQGNKIGFTRTNDAIFFYVSSNWNTEQNKILEEDPERAKRVEELQERNRELFAEEEEFKTQNLRYDFSAEEALCSEAHERAREKWRNGEVTDEERAKYEAQARQEKEHADRYYQSQGFTVYANEKEHLKDYPTADAKPVKSEDEPKGENENDDE